MMKGGWLLSVAERIRAPRPDVAYRTNRTNRPGLMISVDRRKPEVTGDQANRRESPWLT
jgi:hypothetical protein